MNAQHTPGPWTIQTNKTADGDKMISVFADDGVVWAAYECDRNEANALLIAAAPELLLIATRLVEEGLSTSLVSEARSVIAKVTGGQP